MLPHDVPKLSRHIFRPPARAGERRVHAPELLREPLPDTASVVREVRLHPRAQLRTDLSQILPGSHQHPFLRETTTERVDQDTGDLNKRQRHDLRDHDHVSHVPARRERSTGSRVQVTARDPPPEPQRRPEQHPTSRAWPPAAQDLVQRDQQPAAERNAHRRPHQQRRLLVQAADPDHLHVFESRIDHIAGAFEHLGQAHAFIGEGPLVPGGPVPAGVKLAEPPQHLVQILPRLIEHPERLRDDLGHRHP